MRTYQNLVGQTINGLEIYTILRFERNQPVYGCRCLECKAFGVAVPHRLFLQGNAKCTASTHGRVPRPELLRTATGAGDGHRTSSIREAQAFERSQRKPQPAHNPEAEKIKAQRIETEQQENERIRAQHARYAAYIVKHGHPLEDTISLERWFRIGRTRDDIMAIIDREERKKK